MRVDHAPTVGCESRTIVNGFWNQLAARDVSFLTVSVLLFGGGCVLQSLFLGAPLVMPEGDSPVLRTDVAFPMVATVGLYLGLRIVKQFYSTSKTDACRGALAGEVAVDLYLLGLFFLTSLVHFHFKMWIPLVNPSEFDGVLFAIDQWLSPVLEGFRVLRAVIGGPLPLQDAWYDVVYFAMFPLAYCSHALGDRRWLYPSIVALVLVHVIGVGLYYFFPASGPFIFEEGANARATVAQEQMYAQYRLMREGGVAYLEMNAPAYFSAPVAAMPSLHVAASFSLAYYAVRGRIWLAPLAIFVAVWMPIEAVVSRWHYLVDVPAGLLFGLIVVAFTNRLCAFRLGSEDAEASGAYAGGFEGQRIPAGATQREG